MRAPGEECRAAIDKYSNEQRRALGAGGWVTHLVGFIVRSIETLR